MTGLKARTKAGRPDWDKVFTDISNQVGLLAGVEVVTLLNLLLSGREFDSCYLKSVSGETAFLGVSELILN